MFLMNLYSPEYRREGEKGEPGLPLKQNTSPPPIHFYFCFEKSLLIGTYIYPKID